LEFVIYSGVTRAADEVKMAAGRQTGTEHDDEGHMYEKDTRGYRVE
jgi:hypothetical protein